jgi:2',3'-cyclic-nucleotide 2'-phosphodiesterase/3'-nucleotidase/5'-nucleotidase
MRNMNAINVLALVVGSVLMLAGTPVAGFDPIIVKSPTSTLDLRVTGTYKGQIFSTKTPTAPGYDAETRRLFVGSVDRKAVDVFKISDRGELNKLFAIDLTPYGGEPNGLDVKKGIIAVTVNNADPMQPGKVVFFNADGRLVADPIELEQVGKIAFTPNGRQVVVVIPGTSGYTPNYDYVDPEGAIAIIDLGPLNWGGCRQGPEKCHLNPTIKIADFKAYNSRKADLIKEGVRIYGPNDPTVAQDVNPESFTISQDSRTAWVSLERNNALGVVDLQQGKITDIIPLGRKNHNELGKGFAASDKETVINIRTWPVYSFYSPDGIAVIGGGQQSFLVTANEGDPKDFYDEVTCPPCYTEKVRVRDITLDPGKFPDFSELQKNVNLGRLNITKVNGDTDGDGDFDELYMLGSRSFSIWTLDGQLVFDSGDDFEQITAAAVPLYFNTSEDENTLNARSDDRGPEPEQLVVGKVGPRQYVFVSFERISGIIVYDITNPYAPRFEQYINNRNFAVDPQPCKKSIPPPDNCVNMGDLEPEGLLFLSKEESPLGVPMLAVSHEASDTITLYRIDQVNPSSNRYGKP